MKKALLILFVISVTTLCAQEYKSFSVENISEDAVWPAISQTFKELKLPRFTVNKIAGTGESGYYNYTSLMIKNRCKFKLEYTAGKLIVGVSGRQYLSDGVWVDNIMPMSKKQASKMLSPIEKRITKLTEVNAEINPNTNLIQEKGKEIINLKWISKSPDTLRMEPFKIVNKGFVLKTNYPEIPINISLSKSEHIRFVKESSGNGYCVVHLYFDEPINENIKIIAKQTVENKEISAEIDLTIISPKYYHTPNCEDLFSLGLITESERDLCIDDLNLCRIESIKNGNFLFESPKTGSLYLFNNNAFLNANQKKFLLNDNNGIKDFVKPSPCMEKWFEKSQINIKWISKSPDTLRMEPFKIVNKGFVLKTNYPEIPINISLSKSEHIRFVKESSGNGYYVVHLYFDEPINENIKIIAKQTVENNEIYAEIDLTIISPKYYHTPNCEDLFSLGLITESERDLCIDDLNLCRIESIKNGNFLFESPKTGSLYLFNNNAFLNANQKKFLLNDNNGIKDFVKSSTCMAKWFGLADKETIVSLAHEAMDKIKAINDKIEALQKVVNEKNYMRIGMDIKKLEDTIEPIRKEYGIRINKIAEKGTIQIETKMTDPAKYYRVNSVKLVGAHWENRWLDILIAVDLVKSPIPKMVNDEQFYETAGDIRFNYLDKEGNVIRRGTSLFTKFAMPFETYEKIDLIDFKSSLSVLRKKTSKDGLDTFY